MLKKQILDAPTAWNYLNGVLNIYKPAGITKNQVRQSILVNLCKDLNELPGPPIQQKISIEPDGAQKFVVRKIADLADHILAAGPHYQLKDIKCGFPAITGRHTSGVLLVGLNRGLSQTTRIHNNKPIRVYRVSGAFGVSTETHFVDSRVTAKASYRHLNGDRLSSLVASLQASHQRKMFELCGVDIQSQAAYELASKGLIRPADNKIPVIYGLKLIDFKNPDFTLEIHAINEDEDYLATLIHEIGIEMRSVARCTAIRCIRHGHFTIEESLLRRHWNLNGILNNLTVSNNIITQYPKMLRRETPELSPD